jgi:hypothetical protein
MVEMTWDLESDADGRVRLRATWATLVTQATPQPLPLAS